MYRENQAVWSDGEVGQGNNVLWSKVSWAGSGSIKDVVSWIAEQEARYFVFEDGEFFANHAWGIALCRRMRVMGVNVLWSAVLENAPSRELLREMRLAGCQHLTMRLWPDAADAAYEWAREFGFDFRITHTDGMPYATDRVSYTVADREAVAETLPGLHTVQFDLAVAYFGARRYGEVMRPLGKAMTLGYPANELCLNLLACLSAAKHYPDVAAGLLDQAYHGWPHPVVMRNRRLLRSWLESGGDVKGVRLMLEPESQAVSFF